MLDVLTFENPAKNHACLKLIRTPVSPHNNTCLVYTPGCLDDLCELPAKPTFQTTQAGNMRCQGLFT